jgi:hypothetical protein
VTNYERVTSVSVYKDDRDWLQERQRKVSFERNRHVPMCDLVRELVKYVKDAEAGAGA